jgi:hypothetical protein
MSQREKRPAHPSATEARRGWLRVEPEGPAVVGQRFVGWSRALGRRWRIDGEIQEVDAERHQILFRMSLPGGVVGNNRILCARIDEQSCTLRYG